MKGGGNGKVEKERERGGDEEERQL